MSSYGQSWPWESIIEPSNPFFSSVGFEGHAARMMPNVNCAISSGTLVISARPEMPREFMDLLQTLGSSVGSCIRVDEAQFNAASAISGCGPAFVAIAMEAVADGGVVSGLNRELAVQLTAEMFKVHFSFPSFSIFAIFPPSSRALHNSF
jgi:pyrroline-5-carboxylate reductase